MENKTILVIEDETYIRENIEEILFLEDFNVITAENGKIGVELARSERPDLIISDVMMPELDGYGVLTELQKNEETAAIPFIFLTAKADRNDWRKGIQLGADDYLTKPFTPPELLSAIEVRFSKQAKIDRRYQKEKTNDAIEGITQLPNQLGLQQQFDRLCSQEDNSNFLLLILYLDQFNWLNATLENESYTWLLQSVTQRLKEYALNNHKIKILAYSNNNRFVLVFDNVEQDTAEIKAILQEINQLFKSLFIIKEHQILITTSIGIASGDRSITLEQLIGNAEIAMQSVKSKGGNGYKIYTSQMTANANQNITLQSNLYRAIEKEQFQVYYQPKVELQTGQVIGAEALVRWMHPEKGFISPGKFIPMAEETGLIVSLGEWILKKACSDLKLLQNEGLNLPQISVNLSPLQFNESLTGARIEQILTEFALAPTNLDLELTESALVENSESAKKTLEEFKNIGISLSLDDFGTGYSSLSYLQQFPFDYLKIDQSFVRNLVNNPSNMAIITAILNMARSLNLKVIAEGVETEKELTFLKMQKCDIIQGYLFSRPLPFTEFKSLLQTGKSLDCVCNSNVINFTYSI